MTFGERGPVEPVLRGLARCLHQLRFGVRPIESRVTQPAKPNSAIRASRSSSERDVSYELGRLRLIPVDLRRLCAARQQAVEQIIETFGDVQRRPDLSARGALLDRYAEDDGGVAVSLGHPCTAHRTTLAVVALLAAHQLPLVR